MKFIVAFGAALGHLFAPKSTATPPRLEPLPREKVQELKLPTFERRQQKPDSI